MVARMRSGETWWRAAAMAGSVGAGAIGDCARRGEQIRRAAREKETQKRELFFKIIILCGNQIASKLVGLTYQWCGAKKISDVSSTPFLSSYRRGAEPWRMEARLWLLFVPNAITRLILMWTK